MRFSKSLISTAVAVSIFAIPIMADTTTAAAETTAVATTTGDLPNLSSAAASESAAAASSTETTASSDTAATGSSASQSVAVITGGDSTETGTSTSASALPTLAGAYKIPVPSVPPTSNAPYMKLSNYPEGTVFIAVGAILGFLALCVLLWRTLIVWALHRSVKRAAMQQGTVDQKQLFQAPTTPFYKYADKESTLSLAGMGKGGKKGRPTTANGPPSQTSLFFSPTAHAGGNTAGNRNSNYLPAGYYAAGASAPGNGQSTAHLGDRQSISMSNLAPSSGYARAHGISPPDSPAFNTVSARSSMLDLNRGGGGGSDNVRAPSAYLEDLFDEDFDVDVDGHSQGPPPPPQHHTSGEGNRRSSRY